MDTIQQTIQEHSEQLLLTLYFAIIALSALFLVETLGQAWTNSQIFRELLVAVQFYPNIPVSLAAFTALVTGIYIGLLTLFTLDPKKRWQGLILWIGTVSGLLVLASMGLLIPNIELLGEDGPWFVGGLVLGLLLGGGRKLTRATQSRLPEFRRAGTLLLYGISLIVILGIVEYHVLFPEVFNARQGDGLVVNPTQRGVPATNTNGLFVNLILSGIFIGTLRRFVRYDAQETFVVLGPRESGKTMFFIGLYIAALDKSDNDEKVSANAKLMEYIEEFDTAAPGNWMEATAAGDGGALSVEYVSGDLFPKNVTIESRDFAGELLEALPEAVLTGGRDVDDPSLAQLADMIVNADTLLLIIDVERFVNNEELDIAPYNDIMDNVSTTNVLLIATKSDYLTGEFEEQTGLPAYKYFDDFRDHVTKRLTNSRPIEGLVRESGVSNIHPVWIPTEETESGDRVPLRGESGSIQVVGFEELLDRIG